MGRRFLCLGLAMLLATPGFARGADTISRGQFVQLLWQWDGSVPFALSQTFTDVDPDSPWAAAVAWAEELGLVQGDGQGRFFPEEPLTHAHLELILGRYDAHWDRPGGVYLPGSSPGDPVTPQAALGAVERFYREGAYIPPRFVQ